ncbi:MAG TPA: hypothetical protein VIE15_05035 [Acidimicrobiales bacterium]
MQVTGRGRRTLVALGGFALLAGGLAIGAAQTSASATTHRPAAAGHVLLVGTFKGVKGGYASIQSAVNAAKPGDWVLVAPGDYHEAADLANPPGDYSHGQFGGVLVTTPSLHLRGMDRSKVIVDGTKPGSPACTNIPADQQFGHVLGGQAVGRNGIVVYKANHVSVENLTTCNFLSGSKDSGNGVWWNGGAESDKVGLAGYNGAYLTATSTFFNGESTSATYGIFSSNAAGPATWNQLYSSNQNDSGMYVGACQQLCGITITNAWMEFNALGYSGTNSGGAIVIAHSKFDNNQDGFDTNTQIGGDPPAPQNGACPNNGISKITHTHSCWVLMDSVFTNNDNANAPASGGAAAGPTGTGMTLSGGRNDTVMHNTFSNNGAWGILYVPYPDSGSPSFGQTCASTGGHQYSGLGCVYDPQGDALIGNTFKHNGYYKNPSNSDFGELTLANHVVDCFSKNVAPDKSFPTNLQSAEKACTGAIVQGNAVFAQTLYHQALCDTGFGSCPPGSVYPKHGAVILHALPKLPTMPNPCAGVPSNPWCKAGRPI